MARLELSSDTALVVSRYGASVLLLLEDQSTLKAAARRKFEHIACGDRVRYAVNAQGEGVVEKILPRKNALKREDYRGKIKTLACNIDQLVIVAASKPFPEWTLVDQMIVSALSQDIDVLILAHKCDLPEAADAQAEFENYASIGHTVIQTSINDAASLATLGEHLDDKINVLAGQSGVGKSSITREILEEDDVAVGELSEAELGQHTTTVSRCYPLKGGGYLIDSPGIREFTPTELSSQDIAWGYKEIAEAARDCKFSDCQHLKEPECAVIARVESGQISRRRFESFRWQLEENDEDNAR